MAGKLVHFELPAEDTARARSFWSGVMGWQFGDSAMPDFEYYMVQTGEDQGGAIYPADPGQKGPIVYFDTDDIDAVDREGARQRRPGGGQAADPAHRLVRAVHRHRGQLVLALPERRVGRLS